MTVKKTVLEPDYGKDVAPLRDGKVKELVHSKGVRIDLPDYSWILLSGMASTNDELTEVIGVGDYRAQTRRTLEQIRGALEEQGASMDDIVRVRVYVVGLTEQVFQQIHEVRAEFFNREHYPASTLVEVVRLAAPDLLIEIDTDAIVLRG